MNTNCSELLTVNVMLYICEMHFIIYPLNLSQKQKRKYFPNIVAGCELPYPLRIWKIENNGDIGNYPDPLPEIFRAKGRELRKDYPAGPYGQPYTVGRCAEQRACRNIFQALPKEECNKENFNDLYFSTAIQPRTFLQKDYCDNCKTIFS